MYQSLTHFHWDPLYALGSVAKKGTEGEREQEKREKEERPRQEESSMRARTRFSRWSYLICLIRWVNLGVHVLEDACTEPNDEQNKGQIVSSFIVLGQILSHEGTEGLQGEVPVYYP